MSVCVCYSSHLQLDRSRAIGMNTLLLLNDTCVNIMIFVIIIAIINAGVARSTRSAFVMWQIYQTKQLS